MTVLLAAALMTVGILAYLAGIYTACQWLDTLDGYRRSFRVTYMDALQLVILRYRLGCRKTDIRVQIKAKALRGEC